MKRLIITGLILCSAFSAIAQTFRAKGGDIPDFNGIYKRQFFPIEVKGMPHKIDSAFGLETVCLGISHPKISDLKIQLMAPDSTMIWITNRNGGYSGKNYDETCFNMSGFKGYVDAGLAPFQGTYIPDGKISFMNNGQNPNGQWYLVIEDLAKENTGTLYGFSLTFGNHPPDPHYCPCTNKTASGCHCPDGKDDCDLLPDLIVSEKMTAEFWQEYAQNDPIYPGQLRLAVATANIGAGPLETHGSGIWLCGKDTVTKGATCLNGVYPRQIIYQYIYHRSKDKVSVYKRPAGTNYYDSRPGHNHFHADDWVNFTLRKMKKGEKDPRKWPILGSGTKASYCLFDSGICTDENGLCQKKDKTNAGQSNLINYGFGYYPDCNAGKQGISVGGIDNYGVTFEGQFIMIPKGTKNGDYYIIVEVDPQNNYLESDETNNVIEIPIHLTKQPK